MYRVFVCSLVFAIAIFAPAWAAAPPPVARETLSNGLRVVVVSDRLAPVVTTVMTYGAGSDDETIPGLAHATEHMLFRGSATLSETQFADIATRIGATYNAATTNRDTTYYFTLPSQYLSLVLHVEAARMNGALIAPADWATERGAIEQEVRARESSPTYALETKLRRQLFGNVPYATDALGTVESFDKMTAGDIRGFYGAWYHPNNATLVIAGDVNAAATLQSVRQLFGALPAQALPARTPQAIAPLVPKTFAETANVPAGSIQYAYRLPGTDSPDYASSVILLNALNNARGAIGDLVVSGKAFGAYASGGAYPETGYAYITAGVRPGSSIADVQSALDATLATVVQNGIPAQLVDAAKRRIVNGNAFELASIQGLAFAWANALSQGRSDPQAIYAAFRPVTTDAVNRVLRTYLAPSARVTLTVEAKAGAAPSRLDAGALAENVHVEPPARPEPLPSWAQSAFSAPLKPPGRIAGIARYTLPNGIRLIVHRERRAPVVVLEGSIKNNPTLHVARGKDGVDEVTAALIGWGTERLDRKAFGAALDAIPANVSLGTRFTLSARAVDFDRALALLAGGELHPAFPADGLALIKRNDAQAWDAALAQPAWQARLAMEAGLYPPLDPVRRHPSGASIRTLDLKDVRHWYGTAFRPDLTTIAVVGDLAPAYVRAEIAKYFGAWKARGPKPDFHYPTIPLNRSSTVRIASPTTRQSQVTLTELLPIYQHDKDAQALELADTILTGEGSGSLLFEDLRKEKGYVYNVDSTLDIGKVRSTYQFSFAADPEDVENADVALLADIKQLQTTPLPADELQRAKQTLLASSVLPEASYGGLAAILLSTASETRGADGSYDSAAVDWKRLFDVTPQSLQAAMARWIRPADFVRVTITPAAPATH